MSLVALLSASIATAVTPTPKDSALNRPDGPVDVHLSGELGTLSILAHRIQLSKSGSMIDYVEEGGQDNLFPYARLQADIDFNDRHTVVLLYQPINIVTKARLARELTIDNMRVAADTPMEFRYGFDFYRGSWLYDLNDSPRREVALGLSLQIRNATIDFERLDGAGLRSSRDIGPVPILKFRTRQPIGEKGAFWGYEADGFYAPIKYINGSDTDVVGAILDTSARVGVPLQHGADAFLSLRYIGGGAEGTSDDFLAPADGYVENWLHTVALSIGTQLR